MWINMWHPHSRKWHLLRRFRAFQLLQQRPLSVDDSSRGCDSDLNHFYRVQDSESVWYSSSVSLRKHRLSGHAADSWTLWRVPLISKYRKSFWSNWLSDKSQFLESYQLKFLESHWRELFKPECLISPSSGCVDSLVPDRHITGPRCNAGAVHLRLKHHWFWLCCHVGIQCTITYVSGGTPFTSVFHVHLHKACNKCASMCTSMSERAETSNALSTCTNMYVLMCTLTVTVIITV